MVVRVPHLYHPRVSILLNRDASSGEKKTDNDASYTSGPQGSGPGYWVHPVGRTEVAITYYTNTWSIPRVVLWACPWSKAKNARIIFTVVHPTAKSTKMNLLKNLVLYGIALHTK